MRDSLRPRESIPQTASRSVYPFLQGLYGRDQHRHTHVDRPRYSVCSKLAIDRILPSCIQCSLKNWTFLPIPSAKDINVRLLRVKDVDRLLCQLTAELETVAYLIWHHRICDPKRDSTADGVVVWPTMSCFADWSKHRHVAFVIIECCLIIILNASRSTVQHCKFWTVTWPCTTVS